MSLSKVLDWAAAAAQVSAWQAQGLKVVFTNGVFDLLHQGHVRYLQASRALGDKMVLGLNTDASVTRLKGPERPIVPQDARAEVLAALACIDIVVLFEQDTPKELIETVKPDILTKGADYTIDRVVGADFVFARGGKVETITLVPGISTTEIVRRIRNTDNPIS